MEITSGKTDLPAGADSNLRRLIERGKPESVRGIWVWRMSSSERRRRSNVLPNGPRSHYRRGNASTVQRGSRHLVGMGATPVGTLSSIQPVRVSICVEPSSKLERSGAYASQRLSFDPSGKARWGKAKVANRTREIRLSGMKTGARGNVTHGGTVNPSRNRKGVAGNPLPNSARAPALSKLSVTIRRLVRVAIRVCVGSSGGARPVPLAESCVDVACVRIRPTSDRPA